VPETAPAAPNVRIIVDPRRDDGTRRIALGDGAVRILPTGAVVRSAFEDVARDVLASDAPAPGEGPASAAGALTVHVTRYRAYNVAYAEIDVDAALTAGGEVLSHVVVTGRSPSDAAWSPDTCSMLDRAAESAIADAASRVRAALASSPAVGAWRAGGRAAPQTVATQRPDLAPDGALAKVDLRPPPRIGQFTDLAWAAERDPVVKARLDGISHRRLASVVLGSTSVVGLAVAVKIAAGGDLGCGPAPCVEPPGHQERAGNPKAAAVVGTISAALAVAAVILWPRSSVDETVRLWNGRHPDQTIDRAPEPPQPPPYASAEGER
jgi:hypothetical protein